MYDVMEHVTMLPQLRICSDSGVFRSAVIFSVMGISQFSSVHHMELFVELNW